MPFNRQSVARGLTLAANIIANEIRRLTSGEDYPSEIKEGLQIGTAEVDESVGRIRIDSVNRGKIGKEDNNVLITLAFELGAAPHVIEPKGDYPLRIPRSRWPQYKPPPDVDPLYFMKVDHPGMKARPFLLRAMENSSGKVLEVLNQTFEYQILDGPKVEVIK